MLSTMLLRLYHPIQLGRWRCSRRIRSVVPSTDFLEFSSVSNYYITFISSPYSSCNKRSQLNSSSSYRYNICGVRNICYNSDSVYGSDTTIERRYPFGGSSSIIDAPSHAHLLQLKLFQSREFSSNIGRANRRKNQDPDMRVCQSIEELTQMAYEHKDSMSLRGVSAYWTLVSKLLKKSRFEKVRYKISKE